MNLPVVTFGVWTGKSPTDVGSETDEAALDEVIALARAPLDLDGPDIKTIWSTLAVEDR